MLKHFFFAQRYKRFIMKKVFFILVGIFFYTGAFSQVYSTAARNATERLVKLYNLDKEQKVQMLKIQERKVKNLRDIQLLEEKDSELYYKKKKVINYQESSATKRLLHPDQKKIFMVEAKKKRNKQAELMKRLKSEGASMEKIHKALSKLD